MHFDIFFVLFSVIFAAFVKF